MIRTVVVCDVCQREAVLRTRGIVGDFQMTRELRSIGWSQRTDALSEVCPEHTMPPIRKD